MTCCYWKDGVIHFARIWSAVGTMGFPQVDLEGDTMQEYKTGMNDSSGGWTYIPPEMLPEEFKAVLKLRGINFIVPLRGP